jgi:hypothetical protein
MSLLHAARGALIQGLMEQFQESYNVALTFVNNETAVSASLNAEQRGS